MVAGADCIDDLGLLRHGAMGKLFHGTYAPSTIGSFLRKFTFGHLRQLEAAAGRWLRALADATPITAGIDELALVDIDIAGRLVVRRIPELNRKAVTGQETLFDIHRFHAFFTTAESGVLDTVKADKTHRAHAVTEQIHSDLRAGPLARMPSGSFNANAAWLAAAVMAFNLTRAAGTLAGGQFSKATTASIRAKIINIAARIASSARRIRLHLPTAWPWQRNWETFFETVFPPPQIKQPDHPIH